MATEKKQDKERSVEERLKALYQLQTYLSEIDRIRTLRGELPNEVKDREDEIVRYQTRIQKHKDEIADLNNFISVKTGEIADRRGKIAKYEEQIKNVQNNREYTFLEKEKEFESLEKKKELEDIVSETRQQEEELMAKAKSLEPLIDAYTLAAFKRIRKNARNGLGIVTVQRSACGGCFNKIPPQRQLEIKMHKKVIVCEYCGRIMVDGALVGIEEPKLFGPLRGISLII